MFSESHLVEGDWRFERALSLVLLAEASYAQGRDLPYIVEEDLGLALKAVMPSNTNQGFVAEGDHSVILAYAGTNQLSDWIANLKILTSERNWGTVHRGFLKAYLLEEDKALEAAELAKATSKPLWITGHSLGGALAHIAAFELGNMGVELGLCTFGQPRTVSVTPATELKDRLPFGYHRVVNENDIVTRIPPTLPHSGDLIQLGQRRRWLWIEGAEAAEAEAGALSDAEFENLQERIRGMRSEVVGHGQGDAATERAMDRSIEGIIPGVRNHKIGDYRNAIEALVPRTRKAEVFGDLLSGRSNTRNARAAAGVAADIFDDMFDDGPTEAGANVRSLASAIETAEAVGVPNGAEMIPAIMRIGASDWQPTGSIKVLSKVDDLVTILATAEDIESLEDNHQIRSIEISRSGGMPELTASLPFVKARPVDRPNQVDERGENALVGIIDTGIDVLHDAFVDANGTTRIIALWDQLDPSGPSPHAVDSAFPFDFGTLHLSPSIEEMRVGTKPTTKWLRDAGEHGTHVAGIATGRATGDMEDGIAPDAGIAAVIPDMETISGNPASLGYSVSHVNALQFLRQLAQGGNTVLDAEKPIAINVSLGMNAGAHDGQTLLEAAFDSISGQGRDPGFVIVKSAGNERPFHGHSHVDVAKGRVDVDWISKESNRGQDYFEAWYDKLDELEFVLHTPHGGKSDVISTLADRFSETLDGNSVQMRLRTVHPDNGDNVLYISIRPKDDQILTGIWRLEVRGRRIGARTRGLNIWVERNNHRAVEFGAPSQKMTLSIPGTAKHIITVGATDTQDQFPGIIRASSFGPTRLGDAKPEISAPGAEIISAHANQANKSATVPLTGTSMAAPHITGAVALGMSRRISAGKRQLNHEQITSLLIQSAQFSSTLHHDGFGFGILDVANFLDMCDQLP